MTAAKFKRFYKPPAPRRVIPTTIETVDSAFGGTASALKKTGDAALSFNAKLRIQSNAYQELAESGTLTTEQLGEIREAFKRVEFKRMAEGLNDLAKAGLSFEQLAQIASVRANEINAAASELGAKADEADDGLKGLGDGLNEFAGLVDDVSGRTDSAFSRVVRVLNSFLDILIKFGSVGIGGGGGGGLGGKILSFFFGGTSAPAQKGSDASGKGSAGLAPLGPTEVAVTGVAAVSVQEVAPAVAASGGVGFGGPGLAGAGAGLAGIFPALAALSLFRSFDRGIPREQAEAEGRFATNAPNIKSESALLTLAVSVANTGQNMVDAFDAAKIFDPAIGRGQGTRQRPVVTVPKDQFSFRRSESQVPDDAPGLFSILRDQNRGGNADFESAEIIGPTIVHDVIQEIEAQREFDNASRRVGGATNVTNVYTQDKRSFLAFEGSLENRASSERVSRRRG